jgi:hypothetical protein
MEHVLMDRGIMDVDLRTRLAAIFAEANNLDPAVGWELERLQRLMVQAEDVMQEHGDRLRARPNYGGLTCVTEQNVPPTQAY